MEDDLKAVPYLANNAKESGIDANKMISTRSFAGFARLSKRKFDPIDWWIESILRHSKR